MPQSIRVRESLLSRDCPAVDRSSVTCSLTRLTVDRLGRPGPVYLKPPKSPAMRAIVHDADVLGGAPRLAGTRIGVIHVLRRYEGGEVPEEIAADYDGVSVADVHNALAYAFDGPEEIRELEREARDAVERLRRTRAVDPSETAENA